MQKAVEIMAGLGFVIIGLSHVLQPLAWVELFIRLREQGRSGIIWVALIHLPTGLLIVSFHNVWLGLSMIVTILGWGLVFKSTLYLCWPPHAQWILARISPQRAYEFRIAGFFSVALGLFCLMLVCAWI